MIGYISTTMKIKNFTCLQCGSADFERREGTRVACAYCHSLYEVPEKYFASQGNVIINKGAKVTFGKHSNVVINGSLEIESGAEVEFLGKITLLEKSDDETIERAKKTLKQIKMK